MIERELVINYCILIANRYRDIPRLREAIKHFNITKEELLQHPAANEVGSRIKDL